ncbi:MAG: oxygenase MpaB family protein [Candidatus Korobacteraceae bacterium]
MYATLIDSSVMAYDLILPALTAAEREQYYTESRTSATFFGIESDRWPRNWHEFEDYMESMYLSDTLAVSPVARRLAQQVLSGAGSWLRIPSWYRALTAHLLPPRLREEFGLAYGAREKRTAERALGWIQRIYPRLPESVRFVGPYREALCRLNGRSRLSLSVRLSNRLWVGQSTLFSPDVHR